MKIRTRSLLLTMLAFAFLTGEALPLSATQGVPQIGIPQPRVANLADQLNSGLKTTRPEQKDFIERVVREVDRGRLDRRLVNAIFIWSRRRWPAFPFPYFERAMRLEAAKRNVILPQAQIILRSGTQ